MDKDQLRNRYDVLRMQYVTIKALLDQSDFNWDENTCIITAKDDTWGNYIKEYPDAESMRSMGNPEADVYNGILKTEQELQVDRGSHGDIAIWPMLVANNIQYQGKLERAIVS